MSMADANVIIDEDDDATEEKPVVNRIIVVSTIYMQS